MTTKAAGWSYDQLRFTPYREAISFAVQGKNDAILALSDSMDNPVESYEVVIGGYGNRRSVIRSAIQRSPKVFAETPKIMSADQFREFWISWFNNEVRVGTGTVLGQHQ